jgi:peptidoglycan/xylan/chitin deacetylase (PgdA/CDA1 family)
MVFRCLLAAVVGLAFVPAEASAKWPTPAGGQSQSGDPEVIFTFDDGPHELWSPKILDALAAHQVQAIFYWVGRRVVRDRPADRKRKALVDRALREGHLIGNHTVHHVHLCSTELLEAAREIDHNRMLLEKLARMPIILFRTPYGDFCDQLNRLLAERQIEHLHWDIDPQEYNGRSSESTAQFVIGRLRHLRGRTVILMHDTQAASARAMPIILDWIAAENRRRAAKGGRPIRILSGADLLAERHPTPLWSWSAETARSASARLARAVGVLVPGIPANQAVARNPGEDPAPGPTSDSGGATATPVSHTR